MVYLTAIHQDLFNKVRKMAKNSDLKKDNDDLKKAVDDLMALSFNSHSGIKRQGHKRY